MDQLSQWDYAVEHLTKSRVCCCGNNFFPKSVNQLHCSDQCRKDDYMAEVGFEE